MTDNEKAKELAWKRDRGYYTPEYAYKKGFDAGYEARTVPADVREAVATCKSLVATMETKADWPTYSPEYRAALRTLIAAISADSPKEQK